MLGENFYGVTQTVFRENETKQIRPPMQDFKHVMLDVSGLLLASYWTCTFLHTWLDREISKP